MDEVTNKQTLVHRSAVECIKAVESIKDEPAPELRGLATTEMALVAGAQLFPHPEVYAGAQNGCGGDGKGGTYLNPIYG